MPGRNAPCPCGSGRKYEHCCLPAAAAARPAYTAQERQDAFGKLAAALDVDWMWEELRLERP